MAKALTPKTIEHLKPTANRREVRDGTTGLRLVIQPSGAKSWCVRFRRPDGRSAKLTLGTWPALPLLDARARAATARLDVERGGDPAAAKQAAKAAAAERNRDTVEVLAARFIEEHAKKYTRPSSWKAVERSFRVDIMPKWKRRPLASITRRDVWELLKAVAATRPIQANRVKAHLSKFFKWAVEEFIIVGSPMVGMRQPTKEEPHEHVLEADDLVRFWNACPSLPKPYGDAYRLLLLLGARRNEVAGLRFSEIKSGVWVLPKERSKNKREHSVPLSRQAAEIIDRQQPIDGNDFVFGSMLYFGDVKRLLDQAMQPRQPWRNHDLRRSCAAGMQELGIPTLVIEHVLGHQRSGEMKGMPTRYQVHRFDREKAVALQRWADKIDQLVTGAPAKVINLR